MRNFFKFDAKEARRSIFSTMDDTTSIRFGGMTSYLAVFIFGTGKYWTYISNAFLKFCYQGILDDGPSCVSEIN